MICALALTPWRCPPVPLPCALPGFRRTQTWSANGPTLQQSTTTINHHQWTNHQPRPDSTKPQSLYPIAPDPNGNANTKYLMSNSLSLIIRFCVLTVPLLQSLYFHYTSQSKLFIHLRISFPLSLSHTIFLLLSILLFFTVSKCQSLNIYTHLSSSFFFVSLFHFHLVNSFFYLLLYLRWMKKHVLTFDTSILC